MATANITREEAALRSRVVKAETYRVTVDVTGNGLADPERTFASHTELDFTSAGGSTCGKPTPGFAAGSVRLEHRGTSRSAACASQRAWPFAPPALG